MIKTMYQIAGTLLIGTALATTLPACKKTNETGSGNTDTFPDPVRNITAQSMIDSIRTIGGMVNSGTTPPVVNGIYLMQPDSCVYDNSPGNFAGTLFADYKFRFSSQNNSSYTLSVEQKNISNGALNPTPASVYISGSGNNFSIFVLRTVSPSGIAVQQFNILSGTLTAGGIQNFQNILYIRSKGSDPGNTLPPAGTIRRFVTGGAGLAVTTTTF